MNSRPFVKMENGEALPGKRLKTEPPDDWSEFTSRSNARSKVTTTSSQRILDSGVKQIKKEAKRREDLFCPNSNLAVDIKFIPENAGNNNLGNSMNTMAHSRLPTEKNNVSSQQEPGEVISPLTRRIKTERTREDHGTMATTKTVATVPSAKGKVKKLTKAKKYSKRKDKKNSQGQPEEQIIDDRQLLLEDYCSGLEKQDLNPLKREEVMTSLLDREDRDEQQTFDFSNDIKPSSSSVVVQKATLKTEISSADCNELDVFQREATLHVKHETENLSSSPTKQKKKRGRKRKLPTSEKNINPSIPDEESKRKCLRPCYVNLGIKVNFEIPESVPREATADNPDLTSQPDNKETNETARQPETQQNNDSNKNSSKKKTKYGAGKVSNREFRSLFSESDLVSSDTMDIDSPRQNSSRPKRQSAIFSEKKNLHEYKEIFGSDYESDASSQKSDKESDYEVSESEFFNYDSSDSENEIPTNDSKQSFQNSQNVQTSSTSQSVKVGGDENPAHFGYLIFPTRAVSQNQAITVSLKSTDLQAVCNNASPISKFPPMIEFVFNASNSRLANSQAQIKSTPVHSRRTNHQAQTENNVTHSHSSSASSNAGPLTVASPTSTCASPISVSCASPHSQLTTISTSCCATPQSVTLPQATPHFQSVPVPRATPHFQSVPVPRATPHFQYVPVPRATPHFQSVPVPQATPHFQSVTLPRATPHFQSVPVPQATPHFQSVPVPRATPHFQSVPQATPHFQSVPVPQATPHFQSVPLPRATPHFQSVTLPRAVPYSQPNGKISKCISLACKINHVHDNPEIPLVKYKGHKKSIWIDNKWVSATPQSETVPRAAPHSHQTTSSTSCCATPKSETVPRAAPHSQLTTSPSSCCATPQSVTVPRAAPHSQLTTSSTSCCATPKSETVPRAAPHSQLTTGSTSCCATPQSVTVPRAAPHSQLTTGSTSCCATPHSVTVPRAAPHSQLTTTPTLCCVTPQSVTVPRAAPHSQLTNSSTSCCATTQSATLPRATPHSDPNVIPTSCCVTPQSVPVPRATPHSQLTTSSTSCCATPQSVPRAAPHSQLTTSPTSVCTTTQSATWPVATLHSVQSVSPTTITSVAQSGVLSQCNINSSQTVPHTPSTTIPRSVPQANKKQIVDSPFHVGSSPQPRVPAVPSVKPQGISPPSVPHLQPGATRTLPQAQTANSVWPTSLVSSTSSKNSVQRTQNANVPCTKASSTSCNGKISKCISQACKINHVHDNPEIPQVKYKGRKKSTWIDNKWVRYPSRCLREKWNLQDPDKEEESVTEEPDAGVRVFRCEKCEKLFKNKEKLEFHMQSHKILVCQFCGKEFDTREKFSTHLQNHKKRFKCSLCDTVWSTWYNLKAHMLSHTGEKPHSCDECGKGFARVDNYHSHMRKLHPGSPAYKCTECTDKFLTSKELKEHRNKVHPKPEKPTNFPCQLCGKKFRCKRKLKDHVKLHEEGRIRTDKKYKCQECGRSYNRKYSYREHLLRHKMGAMLTCDMCKITYGITKTRRRFVIKEDDGSRDVCEQCYFSWLRKHDPKNFDEMYRQARC